LNVPGGFILLSTPLSSTACLAPEPREARVDRWRDGDLVRAATLLQISYTPDIGRHFAPHGTAPEWLRYVAALTTTDACGTFNAQLTRVIRDDDENLRALALITLLAPATAHLAQLAVHPALRRTGVARTMVGEVAAAAAAAGCDRLTLLVAEGNDPARRLYESLGFSPADA
jgi:ribosomal protein S18 acetylase RimI-like enzyme